VRSERAADTTHASTADDRAAPAAASVRRAKGEWLSIHAACAVLGVDQSTLRRWSDAGKVPVFRTPGGHRRYAKDDLRALVGEPPSARHRPRPTSQALTDRSLSAYEEAYLRAARERRWYRAYGASGQEEHRRRGRRLVDLAVRFATLAPAAGDRSSLLDEGRQIGEHYGRAGAEAGLTASETVEAFLYFRHPIAQTMTTMIQEDPLPMQATVRLVVAIGHFMDQVLIATIEAHDAVVRAGPPPGRRAVADDRESPPFAEAGREGRTPQPAQG
jgi:excisionase family DNA binding protein